MRLVRILLSILILLVVVVVFAVGSFIIFVDPNKLKPSIIATVYEKTGIQLAIDGNLSWSFYPGLNVKLKHVRVTMPNETESFADLYDVKIATTLAQLRSKTDPFSGDIRIDHLTVMNMQVENMTIGLHLLNDKVQFAPITGDLYQGALTAAAEVSQLTQTPHWSWDAAASNIQLKPLLHDVQNSQMKVSASGTSSIRFIGQTEGKVKNDLLYHLNGQVGINIVNGAVEGIDINYLVQTAAALINKQPLALPPLTNQTIFQNLTCSAAIKNGIASTDNLLLTAPSFATKGSGTIDFPGNNLDMTIMVAPIAAKWTVPVLVSGSLSDPAVRLDPLALKTLVAQEDLEKVKNKVQEQVKELPKKADKFLKKLLGN